MQEMKDMLKPNIWINPVPIMFFLTEKENYS